MDFAPQPPAVPEVLDDLAAEFAQHWSIKRIVRRIVLSQVYRQSTEASDELRSRQTPTTDSWRGPIANVATLNRCEIRILDVSGSLDRSLGGEPVEITLDTPSSRRTIYAMIDRQNLPALFRTFDFASPDTHSPGRYFTTVPQQALFLLNSRQTIELSRRTANLVRANVGNEDPAALSAAMFRQVLSREPTAEEHCCDRQVSCSNPRNQSSRGLDARSLWSYGTANINDRTENRPVHAVALFLKTTAGRRPTISPPRHLTVTRSCPAKTDTHRPTRRWRLCVDLPRRSRAKFACVARWDTAARMETVFERAFGLATERRFMETQKKNDRPYGPISGKIEAGQTIDFVASARRVGFIRFLLLANQHSTDRQ